MKDTIRSNKSKIVEKLESELLSTLFNYVIPFIDKKIKAPTTQQEKNLENIVNQKPKVEFKDIKELESFLLKNSDENAQVSKNIESNSNNIFYSLNLKRRKSNNEKLNNYSLSIRYEENQTEEKIDVSIKKEGKEIYSSEIVNKKDVKDKVAPYSIKITYEDNYFEERLAITYKQQLKNYIKKHIEDKEDTSSRVPLKWLNILPESQMGGVLGFTYLGENFMGRRADLIGKTARMVDIHESIHTPDEYETRILTSWIMEKPKIKYYK